jgi:hypothetical protein
MEVTYKMGINLLWASLKKSLEKLGNSSNFSATRPSRSQHKLESEGKEKPML